MRAHRRLALLVCGACLLAASGCAHLLTDPGYPSGGSDAHFNGHVQRVERENREYDRALREIAK